MQTKGEGVKKVENFADVINGCSLGSQASAGLLYAQEKQFEFEISP